MFFKHKDTKHIQPPPPVVYDMSGGHKPLFEDVVGLLLGEVVSTKKKHIIAKDVVGLQVGYDDSLT